jgi:crossover junction endodeoxyribonuclease RusA
MPTITLPWPPKDLSPNARLHWAKLAKAKKSYRHACRALALQAGLSAFGNDCWGPLHVSLVFYPPDRRQRDQDNMLASMKSGLDGLADAMRIDDRKFRTTFEVSDQIGGMVKVTVRPVEVIDEEK